jgi:DNA-binding NarL/FixJ family response regulator
MEPESERSQAVRVLIVDDHPLFRAGVRERLSQFAGRVEVVGEAGDGNEAYAAAEALQPDVILMDISMPGGNGIDATRRIKAAWPQIGVLILTVYDDDQYIYALIDAGAAGYLLKTVDAATLADAIVRVGLGESVLAPSVARKVLARLGERRRPRIDSRTGVTDREVEVLQLAAAGATNKEIASRLDVSVRTVHAHMRHIFDKLGVASRTEAVVLGVREGWLRLERE